MVWYLQIEFNKTWADHKGPLVTSEMLGKAKIPDLPFEKPDGTPYRLDTDYFSRQRRTENLAPGPFHFSGKKAIRLKVWPKKCTKG